MSQIPRRQFLIAASALLAAPLAGAQQTGKVYRIGWLSPSSPLSNKSELGGLSKGLREHGYVEGQNVVIEPRWADGNSIALKALAGSLVELKVDVICVIGTSAAIAAKQATTVIPIVFAGLVHPDQTGVIASYARPGGNVTGVAAIEQEYGKRLELLREISPRMSRVALLYNDSNPGSVLALKETQHWAERLGITLEPHGIHRKEDVETVFAAIAKNRPSALMTTADPLVISYRREIAAFAIEHRLLSTFPDSDAVQTGVLLFYGASTSDMYRQAAGYIHRILQGARPGDLPVEQPVKLGMTINLKTARALGIAIPKSLLLRADRV